MKNKDLLNNTMVIAFCDLKGSTHVLREVGNGEFIKLQDNFFKKSSEVIESANRYLHKDLKNIEKFIREEEKNLRNQNKIKYPLPWARIDKYMGDCTMFYVDCGSTLNQVTNPEEYCDLKHKAAKVSMSIIAELACHIYLLEMEYNKKGMQIGLGMRSGVSLGENIILSWLGDKAKPGYSFTVTGASVNLAARLEHASDAEFISCISHIKNRLKNYLEIIENKDNVHGTYLEQIVNNTDKYLTNLFAVSDKKFQLRANLDFVQSLEFGSSAVKLRWREIPFRPKGFDQDQKAYLLGGDNTKELFRNV